MMNVYMNRFGEQVETVTAQTLLASWPGGAQPLANVGLYSSASQRVGLR
jgi:hypothetical protein